LGDHSVEPLKDRDGNVIGAPVFLSPEEVEEVEETGSVKITQKH
jgi:hypothetical protein